MKPEEYYSFEDRTYVSPTLSRDEQLSFINNLRDTQEKTNQQIENETYALGSKVATSQGGLTSGATNPDSYFMSRYQTPQIDAQVANLKASAQASALNDTLKNLSEQYKQRYNRAYTDARKKAAARSRALANAANRANQAGGLVGGGGGISETSLESVTNAPVESYISSNPYTDRNTETFIQDGYYITRDMDTGEELERVPMTNNSYSNPNADIEELQTAVNAGVNYVWSNSPIGKAVNAVSTIKNWLGW